MYVKRNNEARSCNNCCHGKAIKYYALWVCVCILSYVGREAHASSYIVICGLSGYSKFSHIIS